MIDDLKELTFLLRKLKENKEFNGVYISSEYLRITLDSFNDVLEKTIPYIEEQEWGIN